MEPQHDDAVVALALGLVADVDALALAQLVDEGVHLRELNRRNRFGY